MPKKLPEVIEVSTQQFEKLLDRANSNTLSPEDTKLLKQLFVSYTNLFDLVRDKHTTIGRLRKMLFGATTESSNNLFGNPADIQPESSGEAPTEQDTIPPASADNASASADNAPEAEDNASSPEAKSPPPPGHGRHGADDYPGATQVRVPHATLTVGDGCPSCGDGTLYEKKPAVLIRFVGQAPIQGTVYRLQRLRCHLCNRTFVADAPEDVGDEKYDHSVAVMIGLLKYGSGLPFNRLERLQGSCEIPLAASTQWKLVDRAATVYVPAHKELLRQAAQGDVVYHDDTKVRILELMGERAKKIIFNEDDAKEPKRTGLYTSGVVATCSGHSMALFFSGRRHAGENLQTVLRERLPERDLPIQMCDALSRNYSEDLQTILANCLTHGRRKFADIVDRFKPECRYVIDVFATVYHNDSAAKKLSLSAEERLTYHQTHSKSAMEQLKDWLDRQITDNLVEPNSALGEAIQYLRNHWTPLTLFLRQAGAPLDNNICERALKKAILHRKNSMFYKSRKGAQVGDIHMSLIYTCELNNVNPFDYLSQLHLHATAVAEQPEQWMPWNYRETIAAFQEVELTVR